MDSADQPRQTLVYADGYSYTEIFEVPDLAGMAGATRLISVFHAFLNPDADADLARSQPQTTVLAGDPQSVA